MNCCGETEKKEAAKDKQKSRDVGVERGEDHSGHASHGGHGGCGMHGGGLMQWLWIALLVYLAASFLIK